jgi:hypothetical protein
MSERQKCPNCAQKVKVEQREWGLVYKYHEYRIAGNNFECPGSGKLVK